MDNKPIPSDFWYDHVSKSHGKHNITPEAWERICKIRNSPIVLIEDLVIGESHKPHMVIPKGYKGFLIDYPDAFALSENDLKDILINSSSDEDISGIPARFFGVNHVVFLRDYHYEIISPYFDMGLANYGGQHALSD